LQLFKEHAPQFALGGGSTGGKPDHAQPNHLLCFGKKQCRLDDEGRRRRNHFGNLVENTWEFAIRAVRRLP